MLERFFVEHSLSPTVGGWGQIPVYFWLRILLYSLETPPGEVPVSGLPWFGGVPSIQAAGDGQALPHLPPLFKQDNMPMDTSAKGADAFYERLRQLYDALPFNRVLGIRVTDVDAKGAAMRFSMREELVGNVVHGMLHGGVISAVFDALGGLTASAGLVARAVKLPEAEMRSMFTRVGTIDIRVDYLRPGKGREFTAVGRIMRAGRKLAVVRMEMHADDEVLIAVGTGTYMIG